MQLQTKKLNFGSGNNYREGWVNVDGGAHVERADFRFEFGKFPYPLESNYFDFILATQTLEHIGWRLQPRVLKELLRVTAPQGKIAIRVPDLKIVCQDILSGRSESQEMYNETKTLADRVLHELLGGQRHDEDFHIGSLWDTRLESLLRDAGWKIDQIETEGRTLKAFAHKPLR